MKNILLLILVLVSNLVFSQHEIDTTEIKNIRCEWRINWRTKDSTLTEIQTKYESGIVKKEYPEKNKPNTKYRNYEIFDSKFLNDPFIKESDLHLTESGILYWRNYFDIYNNLDSLSIKLQNGDSLKERNYKIEKLYKKAGKLKYLIDERGSKYIYEYNLFGKLKRIKEYDGSSLYKVGKYKNGLLKTEVITYKNFLGKIKYEYDSKNRLLRKEESSNVMYTKEIDITTYKYNAFGIERKETISKSEEGNKILYYEIYEYKRDGKLKIKKMFGPFDRPQAKYHYTYK